MTHARLTELCVRPRSIPVSECPGALIEILDEPPCIPRHYFGEMGDLICIKTYRCQVCGWVLCVVHQPSGWQLRATYHLKPGVEVE